MKLMRFVKVKNFERFQHYKDRNPVWIKLYNELLDDYAFGCLPDASKLHLVLIWLLASRYDNRIPADPEWIKRRINATEPIDLAALVSSGFLDDYESDSTLLAGCAVSASPEREKSREETETEPPYPPLRGGAAPDGAAPKTNPEPRPAGKRDAPEGAHGDEPSGFLRWWKLWPSHERKVARAKCLREWRRRKLEPIAETVIEALRAAKLSAGWQKQGGAFIPMPLTWIGRTPWETTPEERVGDEDDGCPFPADHNPTEEALAKVYGNAPENGSHA